MSMPTALIAEDEPLLAQALQAELAQAWPALQIVRTVGDGLSAVAAALELQPDVLFFDIRMPGLDGLDAAVELADRWPSPHGAAPAEVRPFPALVLVTAYDQYAVQAFEAQALDYLLKPVQAPRLQKTVAKLQQALALRARQSAAAQADTQLEATLSQLRGLLAPPHTTAPASPTLQVLQASVGTAIRMVPLAEVVYLEAADKYVRVLTRDHEYLLRTPLKDLLPQLDTAVFWQVHRSTAVRADCINMVTRDDAGRLHLTLHHRSEKLSVSRLYAHRFKAM
ncbi:LytTR family DNA-binding domain-containing protein [Acidovorax sp.]|uniref:LytR/AlgR family response regulator transcription factor n=1 Tax=Acidovorax sp. TaxID=1872122 RepID=UPI002ACEB1FF|nr:LytTR family DNA-binding domain-containing protein [Acidovorax sp.]MDZ7862237.1 LytTR family DNA-binding domain-containing protein [Acidovorax sp.]